MPFSYAGLMSNRLALRNHVRRNEAYHFAKTEVGPLRKNNLHNHDFSELFWIESGKGIHWIDGEKRAIGPSTLIFVLPEDFHTLGVTSPEEKLVICNLAFPTRTWRAVVKRHLGWDVGWFSRGVPERRERLLSPQAFDFLRRAGLELAFAPRSSLMLERFFLNLWVAPPRIESFSSVSGAPVAF